MKLYRITLRNSYSAPYVVADNPEEAYQIVKKYLDEKDLCFREEREFHSAELLAESCDYSNCKTQLFVKT